MPATLDWTTARDGSRTARHAEGAWLAGCSLPDRAAAAMARKLEVTCGVACLVAPTHAAQVQAVLEKLRADQAVVVVLPEEGDLATFRACRDFSADEATGRLFFAAGPAWEAAAEAIYGAHPGLPVPGEFVRLAATDAATFDALRPAAERLIGRLSRQTCERVEMARRAWRATGNRPPRLLLLAADHFALWDDDGHALRRALADADHVAVDPLDPRTSGPRAVSDAAADCDAAVAAGFSRADLRATLPDAMPLLTWCGRAEVPAADPNFSEDRLAVASEGLRRKALAAGWPAERVLVAALPVPSRAKVSGKPTLALIADLPASLDPPAAVREFSSHRLLWEAVAEELAADPSAVGTDARRYLVSRLARLGGAAEGVPFDLFLNGLIVPVVQRTLAARLIAHGVPLRIHGSGWDAVPGLRGRWAGPLRTRGAFDAAVDSAAALLDARPATAPPLNAGRPVVAAFGRPVSDVARDAREVLKRGGNVAAPRATVTARWLIDALCPNYATPDKRN